MTTYQNLHYLGDIIKSDNLHLTWIATRNLAIITNLIVVINLISFFLSLI